MNDDSVPAVEFQCRYTVDFILLIETPRDQGLALGHQIGAVGCALARGYLQVAGPEQQEAEHADRVEIDFAVANHQRVDAGQKCQADADRDRGIHAKAADFQVGEGAAEKRPGRIENDRQGQDQAAALQQVTDGCIHGAVVQVEADR